MDCEEEGKAIKGANYQNSIISAQLQSLQESSASQNHYCAPQSKTSWFTKFKTNSRYKISEAPWIGLEQVRDSSKGCVMFGTDYDQLGQAQFMADFSSTFWATYRASFRPFPESLLDSDAGWGCTLRVAQMLLLKAVQLRLQGQITNEIELLEMVQENNLTAPYSIHSFCEWGQPKKPGDWFTPCEASHIIQHLLRVHPVDRLSCKVFMDCVIYKDQLNAQACDSSVLQARKLCLCERGLDCCRRKAPQWKRAMLVMVPIRLGLERLEPQYFEFVKFVLGRKECVGIIGGKPRSALYFVGYQNDSLLILDPHYVQTACRSREDLAKRRGSYHCMSPKLLPMESSEFSMAVGLYFQDYRSFLRFQRSVLAASSVVKGVVSIQRVTPDMLLEEDSLDQYCILQ